MTTSAVARRWATGTLAYGCAGNIAAMGTHTFRYDKLSRLTQANLYLEPTSSVSLRTQAFT
jgi:YD repeat-containing protein